MSPTPSPDLCSFCQHPWHLAGECNVTIEWVPEGVDARHTTVLMVPCQCQVSMPLSMQQPEPEPEPEPDGPWYPGLGEGRLNQAHGILGVVTPPTLAERIAAALRTYEGYDGLGSEFVELEIAKLSEHIAEALQPDPTHTEWSVADWNDEKEDAHTGPSIHCGGDGVITIVIPPGWGTPNLTVLDGD